MVTILDDNMQPQTVSTQPKVDALDSILSGYKKQMIVDSTQPTSSEQKRGRGRPPGSVKKIVNKGPESSSIQQPVNTIPTPPMHPGVGNVPQTLQQPGTKISGSLIGGYMFIVMIDMILPMVINFLHSRYSKLKIDFKKLKLTEAQKRELEPVSNDVVKQLNINGNPIALMLIGLGSIYTMNYMALVQQAEKENDTKK